MTKKLEKNESAEIKESRGKYTAAVEHSQKLRETLAKVYEKKEKLEHKVGQLLSQVQNSEKEHNAAQKRLLREEITEAQLAEIAKKQESEVKAMHDAQSAIKIADQVTGELHNEIREATHKEDFARKKLCAAIRAKLISEIPDVVADKLLEICGTYPEPNWQQVLFETFEAPRPEQIKSAQAEFSKGFK